MKLPKHVMESTNDEDRENDLSDNDASWLSFIAVACIHSHMIAKISEVQPHHFCNPQVPTANKKLMNCWTN
jgi:hypothetical protein